LNTMQTLTLRTPAAFAAGYSTEDLDNQIGCICTYVSLLGTWLEDGSLVIVRHEEPVVVVEVHNQNVVNTLDNMGAIIR
jgi:hypothetical protein